MLKDGMPDLRDDGASDEAVDLFDWLVHPDCERRAGSGARGAHEIKEHAFFAGFDWHKMQRRGYSAPWTPQ